MLCSETQRENHWARHRKWVTVTNCSWVQVIIMLKGGGLWQIEFKDRCWVSCLGFWMSVSCCLVHFSECFHSPVSSCPYKNRSMAHPYGMQLLQCKYVPIHVYKEAIFCMPFVHLDIIKDNKKENLNPLDILHVFLFETQEKSRYCTSFIEFFVNHEGHIGDGSLCSWHIITFCA